MAFSSRCLERLLVKRASYFGHEGTRCLRRNKKDSPRLHPPSSSLILWFNRNSLTGTATDRFTRSVNGNSWLTFFCVCSLFAARAKEADFLGMPAFPSESFIRRSETGNDWVRTNGPVPYLTFEPWRIRFELKKKIARRTTTRKFNLKKQSSLIGSEFIPIKAQRRKFMANVTCSETARFFI